MTDEQDTQTFSPCYKSVEELPTGTRKRVGFFVLWVSMSMLFIIVVCAIVWVVVLVSRDMNASKAGKSVHMLRNKNLYTEYFIEDQFPPKVNVEDYWRRVEDGYKHMKESTIVVTGLARDIGDNTDKTIAKLRQMVPLFKEFKVIIMENDSKDETRKKFLNVEKEGWLWVIRCKEDPDCRLKKQSAATHGLINVKRMVKMASFRNMCLDEIRLRYPNFDYMMVMDMDLDGPISMDGLATCFSYNYWDAMAANGLASRFMSNGTSLQPYDTLALVSKDQSIPPLDIRILWNHLQSMFRSTPQRGEKPTLVTSAFGGVCLYRLAPILEKNILYSGEHCEHIMFHLHMAKHGLNQIFVNPSFILLHAINFSNTKM